MTQNALITDETMRKRDVITLVWDAIIARIHALRGQGKTLAEVGAMIGVGHGTISRWLKGERGGVRTSFPDIMSYLDGLGLNLESILGTTKGADYDYIPHVEAKLGAGFSLETSDEVDGLLAFRKTFLAQVGPTARLVLFDVRGDSMEPTVFDGDTVLINTADKEIQSGQLYAIRIGDELSIKRLERLPGKILVKSDNPKHHTFDVALNELDTDFAVIGRVKWLGRIL